jgi:hypothetical protein
LRAIRSKLTYSNVLASIAMFLALTGGTVMAAKLRTGDIAKNAIKKNQLAKNSIVNKDFRKKSLIVKTATGGGQAANLEPTPPASGLPIPLNGSATTFTPKKGYIGLLMAEAKASLAAAAPPAGCDISVSILSNGEFLYTLFLSDVPDLSTVPSTGAPYEDVDRGVAPIGLTGGTQSITAQYNGDAGCVPAAAITQLKIAIQQTR